MAILQMQRINIYALTKHCKNILESLQRMGVVEIEKTDVSDSIFYREDTTALQASYKRNAIVIRNASDILTSMFNYKNPLLSSLQGRKVLCKEDYYMQADDYMKILSVAYGIIRDNKKIAENRGKISALKSKLESLSPWSSLDVPLKNSSTISTTIFVGSFSERLSLEKILTDLNTISPDLDLFDIRVVSSDEHLTCIFAVCANTQADDFAAALRKLGFTLPLFETSVSPLEAIKEIKNEISELELIIDNYIANITAHKNMIDSFRFFEDYFSMKAEQYEQFDNLCYSPHTFVMTGYIAKRDAEKLSEFLFTNFAAQVELEDVTGEDVPVALSNNNLTAPVEGVLLSYSAPSRKELDPTGIMALFYYVFFGMMFSDAGYGLVMSLLCATGLMFFKNMEDNLRQSLKMFFWCGISTLFWGLMFGSFFGDAVSVVSNTFFGTRAPLIYGITTPIWFNPTEGTGPTKLLMFSFLLGIIHLFTGLILQGINYIRNGKWLYAVYDDLSWMLLVGGAVFALLSTEMLSSMAGFRLSSAWLIIGGTMALSGAVLILFCSARNSNPFKRLIKGAYNLYGVTGYLSDILSYSRLLALGLATGVVAQVFNQLGSMFGSGFVGVVGFSVVFLVGHTLNIGINALGAYVHTNRLQFVEFFGKFYEGGGRVFKPFSVNTKYYNIKENI